MRITLRHICAALALPLLVMTGCGMNDDVSKADQDAKEWRALNNAYITEAESAMKDGVKEYEKVIPSWMPTGFVLMKWHNDRELTKNNLVPLYTSTVQVIYEGKLVNGTVFDKSSNYFADAVYTSQPSENIIGMGIAMTNMHVGDSVTVVIPADLAYGATGSGSIRGYSTLIFNMRLKGIASFEKK